MRNAVLDKMAELITAAFGLIAALAWNDAISAWVKSWGIGGGPWVYAIVITIIAVLVTIWVGRAVARVKK
ncbi:MAG: DUF5654 family protein [Anaerolineae bacterium]|nr:DUF5654 family protein [Anaerolineae bacterium]